jgi:hypothetical protein
MTQPSDEAKDEVVSPQVAHQEFVAERRHEPHEMPKAMDAATMDRLEHS